MNTIFDIQSINNNKAKDIINNLSLNPLYRKSWEHTRQLFVLGKLNLIKHNSKGISFGAGKESLMYYISRIINEMWGTDLYYSKTRWKGDADTDNPENFVKSQAPVNYDTSSLKAIYMDMRDASFFEDNYFDFGYSSCSYSHIGNAKDFKEHLLESYRILKFGGTYIITTEIIFSKDLIKNPGMYFFNDKYLTLLIRKSGFKTRNQINFYQSDSLANYPLPLNAYSIFGNEYIQSYIGSMKKEYGSSYSIPRTQVYTDSIYAAVSLSLQKENTCFNEFNLPNKSQLIDLVESKFVFYMQNALSSTLVLDPCAQFVNKKCPFLLDRPLLISNAPYESEIYDFIQFFVYREQKELPGGSEDENEDKEDGKYENKEDKLLGSKDENKNGGDEDKEDGKYENKEDELLGSKDENKNGGDEDKEDGKYEDKEDELLGSKDENKNGEDENKDDDNTPNKENVFHTAYLPSSGNEKHVEIKLSFLSKIHDDVKVALRGFCHDDALESYDLDEEVIPNESDFCELSLGAEPGECEGYAVIGKFKFTSHIMEDAEINMYDN